MRAEFARQKAEYEQKNRVLETKCAQLAAELEKVLVAVMQCLYVNKTWALVTMNQKYTTYFANVM